MTFTMEILLVEDSHADVRLTKEALKDAGSDAHLTCVPDGEEAMAYLRQQGCYMQAKRPDVILLDLNMPKKNGHEVLQEIKAEPTFYDIPIIVLTVSQEEEDILKALETRMNYYLSKPVSPDRLLAVLNMVNELWH